MKGILSVLYRRILYKIPLKFLLLVLVIILGFISFSEASQFFAYNKQIPKNTNIPDYVIAGTTFYTDIVDINKSNFTGKVRFLVQSTYNCSPGTIYVKDNSLNSRSYLRYPMNYVNYGALCVSDEIDLDRLNSLKFFYGTTQNTSNASYVQFVIVDSDSFNLSVKPLSTGFVASVSVPITCPDCPSCPTIDSEYCINNNLCPICPTINKSFCKSEYGLLEPSECPISGGGTGDISWSALYINNIQHIGGPNIYINIPEEIGRDYDYIDEDMYINVSGYNVDYDKITGIINTQNYKPTTEDFNYIVSSVIPLFIPGLVIILFLYWIFRFIKKIF